MCIFPGQTNLDIEPARDLRWPTGISLFDISSYLIPLFAIVWYIKWKLKYIFRVNFD